MRTCPSKTAAAPYNYPDNFLYSALLLLLLLFNAITRRYLLADIVALSRVHTSFTRRFSTHLSDVSARHSSIASSSCFFCFFSGVSRLRDRSILLKICQHNDCFPARFFWTTKIRCALLTIYIKRSFWTSLLLLWLFCTIYGDMVNHSQEVHRGLFKVYKPNNFTLTHYLQ